MEEWGYGVNWWVDLWIKPGDVDGGRGEAGNWRPLLLAIVPAFRKLL
jgi:hypothetical protein